MIDNDFTGAEDADDAPGLEEEGAGAQHCQLPQRGAEEQVQAGVAGRPERHQTTRGWWLLLRGHGLCEWKTILLLNIQTFSVNVKYAKIISCLSVLSAITLPRIIRFHMIANILPDLNLVLIEDADVSVWIFSIPVDKCILSFRHVEKGGQGWRRADGQGEGAWEALQRAGCSQVPLIRSRVQFKIDAFSVVGNF